MTLPIPQDAPLLPTGQFSNSWRRFFQQLKQQGGGTVTSVTITPANGISGTVTNPTTTPTISLALGAIAPTSVAASGAVTGSNLSGTNTGDQFTSQTASTLLGRGASGAGAAQSITLGTNLSMSGTTLNAVASPATFARSFLLMGG